MSSKCSTSITVGNQIMINPQLRQGMTRMFRKCLRDFHLWFHVTQMQDRRLDNPQRLQRRTHQNTVLSLSRQQMADLQSVVSLPKNVVNLQKTWRLNPDTAQRIYLQTRI